MTDAGSFALEALAALAALPESNLFDDGGAKYIFAKDEIIFQHRAAATSHHFVLRIKSGGALAAASELAPTRYAIYEVGSPGFSALAPSTA
jgi:hypothetical protein